jgi:hypothetical protein
MNTYKNINYNKLKKNLGAKRLKNILHASEQYRYVYISNPKAACSTIKLFLSRCEEKDPKYFPKDLHRRKSLPFDFPQKIDDLKLNRLFNSDFFIFTFVRHPLKRVVSAYGDKIVSTENRRRKKKEILKILGKDPDNIETPVSFDEFVSAIISQKPNRLNPHWRPQFYNLFPNIVKYDYIGTVENINEGINIIKLKLGLPDYPLNKQNEKSRFVNYHEVLTPRNRLKLAKLYAKDFKTFGYKPKGIENFGVFLGLFSR